MATLTKHKTFKSMKQSSSVKVKNVADSQKVAESEIAVFLQLLNKAKAKKA
jgi:hypothetical protein